VGASLTLIGGVIVGITMIRAQVFRAATGWMILIFAVLLIPMRLVGGNGLLGAILINSDLALFYAGLAWAGATLSFSGSAMLVSESSVQRQKR
jgi:hypothetical protein